MFLGIFFFCFYLKHNVSEDRFCLRLQVNTTQLGPIDRVSPYHQISVPAPDRIYKPSTDHLRELRRKYYDIKNTLMRPSTRELLEQKSSRGRICSLVQGLIYVEFLRC
jgi:hypothetical protein